MGRRVYQNESTGKYYEINPDGSVGAEVVVPSQAEPPAQKPSMTPLQGALVGGAAGLPGAAGSFIRGVAQGSNPWSDEAVSQVSPEAGKGLEAMLASDAAQHPAASTAGNLAGVATTMPAAGVAATLSPVATGVAEAALQAGRGETLGERATSAGLSAVGGVAAGAASKALGLGKRILASRAARTADDVLMSRAVRETSPEDIVDISGHIAGQREAGAAAELANTPGRMVYHGSKEELTVLPRRRVDQAAREQMATRRGGEPSMPVPTTDPGPLPPTSLSGNWSPIDDVVPGVGVQPQVSRAADATIMSPPPGAQVPTMLRPAEPVPMQPLRPEDYVRPERVGAPAPMPPAPVVPQTAGGRLYALLDNPIADVAGMAFPQVMGPLRIANRVMKHVRKKK